jgi:hypothetical protein
MAAAIIPFIPLIAMIPGLIKNIQEMIAVMRTPDLTQEERMARLDALSARLDARVAEIDAMQLPQLRTDDDTPAG